MILVGITGQIASGKSVVAEVFKQLGAEVISADQIGKEVVETDPDILQRLVTIFGKQILSPTGKLRRRQLGKIVFGDRNKLEKLNAVVHPALLTRLHERIAVLQKQKKHTMIVIDAALIFEWGMEKELDYIVVVESKLTNQVKRLQSLGISEQQAKQRIAQQLPKYRLRELADYVIHNNDSKESLRRKTQNLYRILAKSVDKK